MIKSMTGYGLGTAGRGKNKIKTEIKTLNSRYLEVKIVGLKLEPLFEIEIRKIISNFVLRGRVQLNFESQLIPGLQKQSFDHERYELIQSVLKDIQIRYGQRINLSDIISINDLLKISDDKTLNKKIIKSSIMSALKQLDKMRLIEGEVISNDIKSRVKLVTDFVKLIENNSKSYSIFI